MKLSEMLTWARSLANLSSSKAISVDDEDKSFNASWKDLYARFLESNDDYFTTTITITPLTSFSIAVNEYLITLPADFYVLRTAEYQDGTTAGAWLPLQKFPLSSRTDLGAGGPPAYRLDNNNLWVKGQSVGSVRVKYYPPPALLTHPQPDLQYATAVTPNNFTLISSPVYAAWKNTGVYIYNVQNIAEGAIDDNSVAAPVTLLAAGANLSNLAYYKGYLYWLQAGIIKRAPTDLITTPLVPANTIATGTVTSFGVFKDKLYYTDAGSMKYANLDGTGPTLILAATGTWLSLAGTTVYYIDGAAALKTTGGATLLASGVSACTSDGTNLYILTTLGEVRARRSGRGARQQHGTPHGRDSHRAMGGQPDPDHHRGDTTASRLLLDHRQRYHLPAERGARDHGLPSGDRFQDEDWRGV
jgi:hypothetical protein